MIEWRKLDQPQFDSVVELLLLRANEGRRVDVVDGRGGDGGIDVRVVDPDGIVTIYQLKFFPEGMSGGHKRRRAQVKQSFRTAVGKHAPTSWVLVIPRNLTVEEQQFVRDLPKSLKIADKKPRISWLAKAELDDMLADYPAVEHWFNRDSLREHLLFAGVEQAILERGAEDLTPRVSNLGTVVDSVDPHWTLDFERRGNTVIQTLRPQHGQAAELAPIEMTVHARLERDPQLAAQLQEFLDYGGPTEMTIPGEYISEFSITGSHLIATDSPPDGLVIRPLPLDVPANGSTIEFEFFDSAHDSLGSYEATVRSVHQGAAGYSIHVGMYNDHLTSTFKLPIGQRAGDVQDLSLNYRLQGLRPSEVSEILEFAQLMKSSPQVDLAMNGMHLTKFGRTDVDEISDEDVLLAGFASDLDTIYRHLKRRYLFPDRFTIEDCVNARVTRRLIDGYAVASPTARSMTCILTSDAKLENLQNVLQEVVHLRWPADYTVTIAGRTVSLGRVIVTHPRSYAINGDAAIRHLEKGSATDFHVRFRPDDDPYFYLYLPSTPPSTWADLRFISWNIPGIEEPWLDNTWFEAQTIDAP